MTMTLRGRWASDAVRVMFAPASEYRQRLPAGGQVSWRRALQVPALLAALLGLTTSVAATGHVHLRLVLSETIAWSFVPLLQLLTGMALIWSAPRRHAGFPHAIELLFAAHAPWSLWLVAVSLYLTWGANLYLAVASAIVPHALTVCLLLIYCGEVLGLSPRQARWRVAAHQGVTVILILVYIELATRLSMQLPPVPA